MAGKVQQMTKTARKELSDAVERYLIDNPNSTAAEAVEYLSSSFKNISPKNIQKTVQTFFTETPTAPKVTEFKAPTSKAPVYTAGEKGPGALAQKLGPLEAEMQISPVVKAEQTAQAALEVLQSQKVPTFRGDIETLTRTAQDNPQMSPSQLAETFKSTNAKKPEDVAAQIQAESGMTTPSQLRPTGYGPGIIEELPETIDTGLAGLARTPEVTPATSTGAGTQYPQPVSPPPPSPPAPSVRPTSSLRQKVASGAALAGGAAGAGVGLNSIFGSERFIPAETQLPPPQKKEELGGPIPGSRQVAAQLLQPEVPEGEKAKEEPKPAPVAPPSVPEGGAPAVTAQPSAPTVDTTSLKEPTSKVAQSQQNLPDALADFNIETNRLNLQNKYGKSVDRQTLKDAVTALGQVDDNIKKLYDNNPPPALADVTKARREALQAYKEKANLNEWLSIADRAINAIAQFASAQAAMGTPYVGSYKPSSTDYESRTAQALREYQAEAGLLKEEREESEKARAEDIRQKEQTGEQMRRAAEQRYRLAQEYVKEQEQAAAQADRMISDIFSANVSLLKNQQDLNAAVEKYRASQAKDDKEAQQKAGKSILELQLEKEKNTIQESQKLLKAANALAISPKDEKVLAEFLAAQGKSGETLQKEINERPEFWTANKIKGLASATATQLEGSIQDANKRSAELNTKLQSLIAGGTIAPAPTPAPSPGQQPATGVKQFKESDIDAGITAGKYPGLTKDEVLRKFKDAGYSVLIGQ